MSAMGAMKALRRYAPLAASVMSFLLVGACADSSNHAAVYVEVAGDPRLAGERTHAYRITVFEYSSRVGGFIEFFEIDGVRNTETNPYFESNACAYFGDGQVTEGEFAIEAELAGQPFLARAFLTDRRRMLRLEVVEHAETWSTGPGSVSLEEGPARAARSCPTQ